MHCLMDIEIDGEYAGRFIFELFVLKAPRACEIFRMLCTGEALAPCGRAWHYAGSSFDRIVPQEALFGGLLAPPDASTSEISDATIPPCLLELASARDSESNLRHDRAGLLSLEPPDDPSAAVPTGFALSLAAAPSRDAAGRQVFGRLVRGYGLLRELEKLPVAAGVSGRPLRTVVVAACRQLDEGDDGVRLGPDGDPFPPWPQDYPGMAGDSGESYHRRAAAAETLKAYGNEAFKRGDFEEADRKYSKALRYLQKRYTREAEALAEENEHRSLQARLSVPLLLNAANARIKLGRFRAAVEACEEAHAIENDGRIPQLHGVKWNAKLLLRRGQALAGCREYDCAVEDLRRAQAMSPNEPAVAAELRRVQAAREQRKARERGAFARAFGGDDAS